MVRQNPPSVLATLRSSTLLNSLSDAQVDLLAASSHMAYAERAEVIWLSGAEVGFAGLVGHGFVKMVRSMPTGQELTAELMGPGQIFGFLGMMQGGGCPLSARAVCNTWYLKMPKRELLSIYEENATLRDLLVRRTTSRLRLAYDMMARMAAGKVEQRLAAVILTLAEGYGDLQGEGFRLTVPLTRQDLAELAGTTVETTIRVLSRWQKEGVLETDGRFLVVPKTETLSAHLSA